MNCLSAFLSVVLRSSVAYQRSLTGYRKKIYNTMAGLVCFQENEHGYDRLTYMRFEVLTVTRKTITVFWMWRRAAVLRSLTIFRSNMLPPSSGYNKFGIAVSSEISVHVCQVTLHNKAENCKLLNFSYFITWDLLNSTLDRDTNVYLGARAYLCSMLITLCCVALTTKLMHWPTRNGTTAMKGKYK